MKVLVQDLSQLGVEDAELPAPDSGHSSDGCVLECVAKGVSTDHSSRTHERPFAGAILSEKLISTLSLESGHSEVLSLAKS